MQHIKRIEIKHFRSIYELDIEDLSDINVFSGLNDVGKSNVLKALNLFFNNQVDWNTPLDFKRDANRLHMRRSSASHNKQLISIKLTFLRPADRYANTLPNEFWIKRQWDRQNFNQPLMNWGMAGDEKDSIKRPRAITEFSNRSHFYYVPAIRHQMYFRSLINRLADSLLRVSDSGLSQLAGQVNDTVKPMIQNLLQSLQGNTGIGFDLQVPTDLRGILAAASFDTDDEIPLELRGDGIQSMAIPSILDYLSQEKKNDFYYWGYEEPENSLEYRKATDLAIKMRDSYSRKTQIFMTTHSPAFLAMENTKTSIYRVTKSTEIYERKDYEEHVTMIRPVFVRGDFHENALHHELGLLEIARNFAQDNIALEKSNAKLKSLEQQIHQLTQPTLVVEGKNDCQILTHAWNRLYMSVTPFAIREAGGADDLEKLVLAWPQINENRMYALFDHDQKGCTCINNLRKTKKIRCVEQCSEGSRSLLIADSIRAASLQAPVILDRKRYRNNRNLEIEHYFPDSVLGTIDTQMSGRFYESGKYIEHLKGRTKTHDIGKQCLDTLIENGHIEPHQRLISDIGKRKLVSSLGSFEDTAFLAFHDLFCVIVAHLVPDLELKLKPELESQVSE